MNRLFAFFISAALAVPAGAQLATAPARNLSTPMGFSSAIGGQARPLGGVASPGFHGNRGLGRGQRGTYGAAIWGYPAYVPGYWDTFGDSGASGPYDYTWPYAPPLPAQGGPAPAGAPVSGPPVIINQYFGYPPPPGPSEAQAGGPANVGAPLSESENYYLIAYKDHSIHAALAYWVEGNTLHYVTTENTHNQVSLDLIDLDQTVKLNRDHNVPFSIPGR